MLERVILRRNLSYWAARVSHSTHPPLRLQASWVLLPALKTPAQPFLAKGYLSPLALYGSSLRRPHAKAASLTLGCPLFSPQAGLGPCCGHLPVSAANHHRGGHCLQGESVLQRKPPGDPVPPLQTPGLHVLHPEFWCQGFSFSHT